MRSLFIGLIVLISAVIHAGVASFAQAPLPTITFDNQSGKPALVGLIGPSKQSVDVPDGQKRTVKAVGGEYYILTRYGASSEGYAYSKGDHFTVTQTATQVSVFTITLHPVPNGNYGSQPVSADEFEKATQGSPLNAGVILNDNTEPRNNKGVAAIGKRQTDGLSQAIAALQDPDSDTRQYAATALGNVKDPSAVKPLIAKLKDSNANVRRIAAWALGEIKDPMSLGPLLSALKDTDVVTRSNAAEALGNIKDHRAVEPLIAHLKDTRFEVRQGAALALGEIRDGRAVEPLIAVLKDTKSFRGSRSSHDPLSHFGGQ